jgi:hypothetical protein
MTIQKTIIGLAIMLLIIFSIFTYYVLSRSVNTSQFPPRISICPDYYENGKDNYGKLHECYNTYKLGNYETGTNSNRNYCKYLPKRLITNDTRSNLKSKCSYAQQCNVGWDGLGNDLCNNLDDIEEQD